MPNYIRNWLTVVGPPDEVARFVAAARGRNPAPGDADQQKEAEREEQPFCFHALVPLPAEYSRVPYGRGDRGTTGFDMEVKTWGVKWGAFSQKEPIADPGLAAYRFTTAWGPPSQFLAKVARGWPALTFLLSWGGEGPTRGTALFCGEVVHVAEDDNKDADWPRYEDYGDDREEEWSAASREAERRRIAEHPVRVAMEVSRRERAGFTEDCPGLRDWLQDRGYGNLVGLLLSGVALDGDDE